jgi:phosphohistidine phosphatase
MAAAAAMASQRAASVGLGNGKPTVCQTIDLELYILRHGIAEDPRPGQRDADRRLIPEGERKLKVVLKLAREAGVEPSRILASPYLRAQETAVVARAVLGVDEEIVTETSLTPEGTPVDVWSAIRDHRAVPSLLLSSHEPLCGYLTAYLLNSPRMVVDVKKGALIRIDLDRFGPEPRGILRWMITPGLAGA